MEEDSGKSGLTEQQFLFRDEEFDDGDFDAAQFVARYRRVTSLESLREQLVSFNQHVQKQLYSIINRDYKDFITISTKLDGLDTRAEMMMKPMFGLQMDMSSLQNGISGSLHLIQDKIDEQREIARKKTTIQKLLRVSSNMDLAKSALNMSTLSEASSTQWTKGSSGASDTAASSSRRNRLYRQAHHVVESHEKDLFVCSEYERAAIALKESQDDLATISQNITSLQNTVSPSMVQELQRNFEITKENLVANVKTHLEHYFSAASTEKRSQSHGTAAPVADVATQTQRRCYGHCLRAVLSLGRGDIAEGALRTAVVEPYVKNALSVGKVDGKLGRGTYSGLENALNDMIAWLETSYLGELLSVADEIATMLGSYHDAKPASFNLIANGVWQPVVHVLQERFPTMQSVGITSVFSHCFRAVDLFAQHLLRVYPHSGARGLRLAVQQYFKTWKLELYSQLRSREVMTRVDAICEQQLPSSAAGAGKQAAKGDLLSLAYTVTAAASSGATAAAGSASTEVASTNTMQKNRLQTATTLASPHLEEVWRDMVELAGQTQLAGTAAGKHSGGFHHELYQALSMETCLVTHPHVALKPVATQCLGLVLRVVQRVVYHVVLLCNASSFPLATAPPAVGSDEAAGDAAEAAAKGSPGAQSFEQLRSEYLGAELASSSTNTAAMSSEELMGHWHDLLHFHALARICLEERVLPRLFASSADASEPKASSLRRQLVSSILQPVLQAAEAVWKRIVSLTAQDCKRPLSTAVKAIAGKYRMTNKPAPTSASPYVGTILEPLEKLLRLKTSPEVLVQTMARLLPAASASSAVTWKEQLCEDLTQVYQDQIVTLLDTVRQMDTALQRRQQQRGKAASASGAGGSGDASGANAVLTDSDKIYLQVKLDVQEYGRTMGILLGVGDEAALASKVPSLSAIATILDQATNRSALSNPPSGKLLGSAQNSSAALSSEDPQGSSPNAVDSISQPTSLN